MMNGKLKNEKMENEKMKDRTIDRINGTQTGNLTGRLLQNLTVRVSHAQLSSKYPGWDRSNETPRLTGYIL